MTIVVSVQMITLGLIFVGAAVVLLGSMTANLFPFSNQILPSEDLVTRGRE